MTQSQLDNLNVQALWQLSLRTVAGSQTATGYFIDTFGATTNVSFSLTTTASGLTSLYRTWSGSSIATIPTQFLSLVIKPASGIIVQNNGTLGSSLNSWGTTSVTIPAGAYRLLGAGTIADLVFRANEDGELETLPISDSALPPGASTSAKQDTLIALVPAALDTGQSTAPEAGRLKVSVVAAQRVKFANLQIAAGAADVVYSLSFSKLDADGQRVITGSVATGTLSTANDSKTLATLYGAAVPADAVEAYLSIDKEARILNSSSTVTTANRLTLMHTLPAGGLYPLTQLF